MKLTPNQELDIVQIYINDTNMNCVSIGKKYNVSSTTINKILKRHQISVRNNREELSRKYKVNQNYFDRIDNEEKAYFLGLLFADGCNNSHCNAIAIYLQEEDSHILEKFRECLSSNLPLVKKDFKHIKDTYKNQVGITIRSRHMSEILFSYGCVPAKSLILKFPSIDIVPESLQRHFIRGYFDGDGSVTISERKKKTQYTIGASIVSTELFCKEVSNIIIQNIGLKVSIHSPNKNIKNTTRKIMIGGSNKARTFLAWLYKDASVFLERKYQRYVSTSNYIDSRKNYYECFGEKKRIEEWSRDSRCKVSVNGLRSRLAKGWSIKNALTIEPNSGKKTDLNEVS